MTKSPEITRPVIKTREDVEHLKHDWLNDPCFDLEDTEGFEEYRDELLAFSNECKARREEHHNKLMAEFARPRSAAEIRFTFSGVEGFSNQLQREIAAQLAESNDLKRLEVTALNNLAGVINLLTHEGGPLAKLTGSAESVAVSLDILQNRGRV